MTYVDTHTHSTFSFDGKQSVDELCASAIAHGISKVAITEHFDTDGTIEGIYSPYDADGAEKAVMEAREKFRGKLEISHGLELGQPYSYPAECQKLIKEHNFDFIIGSLHNLLRVPDFCFLKYESMSDRQIETLWERSLDEIYNLLLDSSKHGCRIDTLGHLTYPVRYIKRAGRELDMGKYHDSVSQIYRRLIENDIALEVNTSGIRQGAGMTFPDEPLIRLYYEVGGREITVGSDAHFEKDVGADIPAVYETLGGIGFKFVRFRGESGIEHIKL